MIKKITFPTDTNEKPIAFFDRDGVINTRPPEHKHVTDWSGFKFNAGIFEVMEKLKGLFRFIIITNQQGIAKGEMTESDFKKITVNMVDEFKRHGIEITAIYYCPHSAESDCECRKPKPGLINAALVDLGVEPGSCILIGDSEHDTSAGKAAGISLNYLIQTDDIKQLNTNNLIDEYLS